MKWKQNIHTIKKNIYLNSKTHKSVVKKITMNNNNEIMKGNTEHEMDTPISQLMQNGKKESPDEVEETFTVTVKDK